MDELLAYAYLMSIGLDVEEQYENKLNELFVSHPENQDFFELEILSGSIKKAVLYIYTHINYADMDYNKFGKTLMFLLEPFYQTMNINRFSSLMYVLWEELAGNLQDMEPFSALRFADEPLFSYNDEKFTRELYEKMLSYYNA